MNFLKKVYCRLFQFAFHAVLPILPYREPEILNSISRLPQLLSTKQFRSVLLVTDPGLRGCGAAALPPHWKICCGKRASAVRCTIRPGPIPRYRMWRMPLPSITGSVASA